MRHLTRISVLFSSIFAFSACGTSLSVRQPTSGTAVDRSMAVMESTMAILPESKTIEEVTSRLAAYCSGEAIQMAQWRAEIEASESMGEEMFNRMNKLMNDAQDTLSKEKLAWWEQEEVGAAAEGCSTD